MNDCVFCRIIKGELPSSRVYENEDVFAFLDIKPVNPGHVLVIPKKHYESIHDTPNDIFAKMSVVAKKIATSVQDNLGAKGVNIGMNNGKTAGQVVFHAHIHVMPRYGKDSLQLWIGEESKADERAKMAKTLQGALD